MAMVAHPPHPPPSGDNETAGGGGRGPSLEAGTVPTGDRIPLPAEAEASEALGWNEALAARDHLQQWSRAHTTQIGERGIGSFANTGDQRAALVTA